MLFMLQYYVLSHNINQPDVIITEVGLMSFLKRILREGITLDTPVVQPLPDSSLLLPTPIGLPLTLNLTQVYVASSKGTLRLSGVPTITDILNGRLYSTKMTANINMKPTSVLLLQFFTDVFKREHQS